MTNDLGSIIEVREIDNYQTVNEYLKLGWIIISTHLWDCGHPVERHQKTVYCLGWNKALGKSKHTEKEKSKDKELSKYKRFG